MLPLFVQRALQLWRQEQFAWLAFLLLVWIHVPAVRAFPQGLRFLAVRAFPQGLRFPAVRAFAQGLRFPAVRAFAQGSCPPPAGPHKTAVGRRHPLAAMPPRRRCCQPIQDEFQPCYASVLVHGENPCTLRAAVQEIEAQRITSCFTAWCPDCADTYFLATDLDSFPCPSAHHTHKLVLLSVLRESGAFFSPD